MPVIDLNEIKTEKDKTFGDKVKNICKEAKTKVGNGINWIKDNPKEAIGILGAGAAIFGAGAKAFNKHVTVKQERYNKERFIYDHSLNAYLETKRKLTNNDIVRINEERRRTGKKLSEVLAEMNLLK